MARNSPSRQGRDCPRCGLRIVRDAPLGLTPGPWLHRDTERAECASSRVLLRADVITDTAVVLAPVEVREWDHLPVVGASDAPPLIAPRFVRSHYGQAWVTDAMSTFADDIDPSEIETRSVPVDVSALAERPCPECDEEGLVYRWNGEVTAPRECPTCGGKGSLRPEVGVVVEQPCPTCKGLKRIGGHSITSPLFPAIDCPICEGSGRRPRVVRYGRPTSVLPVVRPLDMVDGPCIVATEGGARRLYLDDDVQEFQGRPIEAFDGWTITTEPWAADLRPGQTVLLFDELHTCDEEAP